MRGSKNPVKPTKSRKNSKKTSSPRAKLLEEVSQAGRHMSRSTATFRDLIARHCGMTVNDVICANYLVDHGQASPSELAKITSLTTGAVSGIITRLEGLGLVTSERSITDKRQVIVKPVRKAMPWYDEFYVPVIREVNKMYASFTDSELKAIARQQHTFARILEKQIVILLGKK